MAATMRGQPGRFISGQANQPGRSTGQRASDWFRGPQKARNIYFLYLRGRSVPSGSPAKFKDKIKDAVGNWFRGRQKARKIIFIYVGPAAPPPA